MDIGIEKDSLGKIIGDLHIVLANQHILYQKLRNFHWNVTGKHFIALHELFEEHYNGLAIDIDEVAERIRSLGHKTKGTFTEFLKITELEESPEEYPDEDSMIKELVDDHEKIIRGLREISEKCGDVGDTGTEDMLIGMMQKHEKQAWMLRSFLE
jgi:starvation-inducible DNA-binding protein